MIGQGLLWLRKEALVVWKSVAASWDDCVGVSLLPSVGAVALNLAFNQIARYVKRNVALEFNKSV